ncbi:PREDICTED: protocadherin alpha-8-like [Calidris pugnax]|uniref:protocadherin alpha-8-like n=1 Tax=Calidris pugnax TaxID=198806 RepID=UPI00071CEB21|nr:PREDICTED: protocadherin alpha-8-like [Calidris pugnax]
MVVSWGVVLRAVVLVEAACSLVVGQVRYSVPEEAKAGTVVGRLAQDLGLEAVDGEGGRLRLVSPGRGWSVEVSGASGALVVSSRLDREELCGKSAPCALRLEVLVERPLRVFHVELEVTDINDNAPVFRVNEEAFSIAESSLPGSRFPLEGASDADVGANAQLSYTLSPSEYFALDDQGNNDQRASLALILTKPLDRETLPVHQLVLTASDGGRPSLTGTMELKNRGACQPSGQSHDLSFPDRSPAAEPGNAVGKGCPQKQTRSDTRCRCWPRRRPGSRAGPGRVPAAAAAGAAGRMVVSWGVVLRAVVLVEAACSLVVGQVRYSVPEEAKAGTVVGRLAQDLGLEAVDGEGGRLRLVSPGRGWSVEVSGASGALVVSSRLDREELCGKSAPCALRLEVLVERPLRVFHVELEVTDINDNAPVFRVNEEAFSIAESSLPGSRFPLEGASDADVGANAQLSYTLSPSEYFALDDQGNNDQRASLALILTKPLDRETLPVHQLVLTASDGGRPSLTGTMELVISVLDANDNAPQFNQSVYNVKVLEGAEPGTLLITLSATDLDEGINSEIVYLFSRHVTEEIKEMFSIDGNKGEIRLKRKLDYEEMDNYELMVEARDKGSPLLSGHCKVVLEVHTNSRSKTLFLVLTKSLDRETVPVHRLVLTASDGGRPSLTGTMELVISVLDANDNAPQVLPSSVGGGWGGSSSEASPVEAAAGSLWAWASWGAPAGQVVAKIRAVDADSGYNAWLRYELWEPRGKGPFRVGLYSGEVTTSRALEEADGPRQRLVIVVRDHGEPSRSATATLSVSLVEGGEGAASASGGSSSLSGVRPWSGSEGVGSSSGASSTNVWLVVAICAVSSVFLLAVVLYGASRWAPRAAVLSGAGPATLVCASEVGSWSYSQRQSRSLCVAEGAGKSDLMVFSPNFPPPPPGPAVANGSLGKGPSLSPLASGVPKHPNPDWRYSASLRAGMQSAVHVEEAGVLRGGPGGPDQQWPTVSSATTGFAGRHSFEGCITVEFAFENVTTSTL